MVGEPALLRRFGGYTSGVWSRTLLFHLRRIAQEASDCLGELSELIGRGNSMIGTHEQWSDLAHSDLTVVDHRHPFYPPHRDT